MLAVIKDHTDIVKLLLEHQSAGSSIDVADKVHIGSGLFGAPAAMAPGLGICWTMYVVLCAPCDCNCSF